MTTPIPDREPDIFYAGDTLKFRIAEGDYPAPTWSLEYSLVRDGEQITFSSTNDEGSHLVNVAATTTADWGVGMYNWIAQAVKGAEKYTLRRGQIDIRSDFAAAGAGLDARTHVKKVLDALEATILGKASKDQLSYTINSRSISRMSADEVTTWHSHYTALYRDELDAERISRGQKSKSKIRVRFN